MGKVDVERSEDIAFAHSLAEKLKREMSSDLNLKPLSVRSGHAFWDRSKLLFPDKSKVLIWGADSRKYKPLGVPFSGPDGNIKYYSGFVIGEEGDRDTIKRFTYNHYDVTYLGAKVYPYPLLLLTPALMGELRRDGQLVRIDNTIHESAMTSEDRELEKKRAGIFLRAYLHAMLVSISKLSADGLVPRDLLDEKVSMRMVGHHLSINMRAFGPDDYKSIRGKVADRDGYVCRMPILGERGELKGICGMNLRGYYPRIGNTRRALDPKDGQYDGNHIGPRGVTTECIAKAVLSGLIEPWRLDRPEEVWSTIMRMNLVALAALPVNSLATNRYRYDELLTRTYPGIDAVVNTVINMNVMCPDCHRTINHRDMPIADRITTFIDRVDRRDLVVPSLDDPKFPHFEVQYTDLILDGGLEVAHLDDRVRIDRLHEARRSAGLGGEQPYWSDEFRPAMVKAAAEATKVMLEKQIREEIRRIDARLAGLGPKANISRQRLLEEREGVRTKALDGLHIDRRSVGSKTP